MPANNNKKKAPVLSIVQIEPSRETIRACEKLLELACDGKLRGLMWIAHLGSDYKADVVGLCEDRPTTARGMLPALQAVLDQLIDLAS